MDPQHAIKPNEDNDDIVIVDYTAPYESSGWKGAIHLEIDRKNHTITSKGWANGRYPLSTQEKKKYLEFFSDLRNLNDFFNKNVAYSTPVDHSTVHAKWYELKIQWNGKSKAISVGHPDIPFKHPFWMY